MNSEFNPLLPSLRRARVPRQNHPASLLNPDTLEITSNTRANRRAHLRSVALLLFVTMISLAVLAKKNQYLPRTDPGRHVSKAIKIDQGHREVPADQSLSDDSTEPCLQIPKKASSAFIRPRGPSYSLATALCSNQLRSPPSDQAS